MSVEDAARDIDLGNFKKWVNWERIAMNVARLYLELKGEDPLTPIDITAARALQEELIRSG